MTDQHNAADPIIYAGTVGDGPTDTGRAFTPPSSKLFAKNTLRRSRLSWSGDAALTEECTCSGAAAHRGLRLLP